MPWQRVANGFLELAQLFGLAVVVLVLSSEFHSLRTPVRPALRYEWEPARVASAVENFQAECRALPLRLDELIEVPPAHGCRPPPLDAARLRDHWGRAYHYAAAGDGFELRSAGGDARLFTPDDIVRGDATVPWRAHYRPPTDWPRLLAALVTVLLAGLLIAKLSSLLWRGGRLLGLFLWRLRTAAAG